MKTREFEIKEKQSDLLLDIWKFQTDENESHDIVIKEVIMGGDVVKGFYATVVYTD